jgi:thiol-disulfide isomerase/thioredoxin
LKRRTLWVGGAALAAGAAGAGLALWQTRDAAGGDLPDDFWTLRFEQPDGGTLALGQRRGQPLLLNFWATWCPPCVTEMPMLDAFHRAQQARGWQVVGLAVDSPTPVREFLRERPMGFAIGLAGMTGVDLTRRLGNTNGGLPFTLVVDRSGRGVQRKLGALQQRELDAWAAAT